MTTRLAPYAEYKNSEAPWSGAMPSHWHETRMKNLFNERIEKGFGDLPLLTASQSKGVIPTADYETRTVEALKDFHLLKLVNIGDFVISLRSFQGGIEISHARGIISPAYTILTPRDADNAGFLRWYLKSSPFIDALRIFVTGIRQGQNIDYNKLGRSFISLPSSEEQQAIARFLDWQDRRISRFIRAKRRMIELLNEQKQAIIHHAVTRGLNPDAPLKPSGIDWLGDIPAHWTTARIRNLISGIDQGVSPQADGFLADNDSWGVLKAGCVNGGVFRETEHKKLSSQFAIDPRIVVQVGDVIISRASGSPKLVGSVGRVRALSYNLILSDKNFRLRLKDPILADFLVYGMNTHLYRTQVEQAISGAEGLANNLPVSALKTFRLPVPPPAEAVEIVHYLDKILGQLDSNVVRTQQEIDLIREYRTRLIADVVTGKLDVRNHPDAAEFKLDDEADEPVAFEDSLDDMADESGDLDEIAAE